ncbi:MAG: 50S ribosomal protein L6 [Phycisphaerales bacterium]|jgi:large subunit ribosomal protein L6|nr:50S ribosomal protein L6 [Phycisphaerales bacterium]
MSRIGKQPIAIPSGVEVKINEADRTIDVKGPKGNLTFDWRIEVDVKHNEDDKQLCCAIADGTAETRESRSLWGTTRSRINNMVEGVTNGFTKKLKIVGVGWNAQAQGQKIVLNIGYCHPVDIQAPDGVSFEVEKGTEVTITGADKQAVGQFAAVIRSKREPEPYNGKGIMYHDEVIIRKQGKAFGV